MNPVESAPQPVLPLNKVDPPTPDLTSEEIAKIQANLCNIKQFVKDCWIQQTDIITGVWSRLQAQMNRDKTSDNNLLKKFFENFFEVGSFITGMAAFVSGPLAPIFLAASLVLGTTAALMCTNGSEVKGVMGGDDVSAYAATHFQINDAWYHNMFKMLNYYINNTNACRDYIFTAKGVNETATLRTLIDHTFPTSGTCYDNWLTLCFRIFKRNLVLPEMAKPENQFLDIYFIQDDAVNPNVEFGHVYQPCAAPCGYYDGRGTERERVLNIHGVGTKVGVWGNDEVRHYRKDIEDVSIFGTSDENFQQSWLDATRNFLAKMPHAYIYPWAMDTCSIYTQKYFIIEGFAKMRDDQNMPEYQLANADFLNWLFIDDGVGNITNPEGVAFRYEVFRTKRMGFENDIFLHAQQVSDDIIDIKDAVWTLTAAEYRYGPADSREMNEKFHVYTGDLLLKNIPMETH